jgi:hypothetical protein
MIDERWRGYFGKLGKWCCGHGFMTRSSAVDALYASINAATARFA